jgi:hypothetical protein
MQQLVIWVGAVTGGLWGLLTAINSNERLSAGRTLRSGYLLGVERSNQESEARDAALPDNHSAVRPRDWTPSIPDQLLGDLEGRR